MFLASGCGPGQDARLLGEAANNGDSSRLGRLQFDQRVPERQQSLLLGDLRRMRLLEVQTPSEMLLRIMKIRDASTSTLLRWLDERVRYVVGEDYDYDRNLTVIDPDYAYEKPTELPQTEGSGRPVPTGKVLMVNVGAALYHEGKKTNRLLGLHIEGHGEVALTSPRVGVLGVGQGMFELGPAAATKPEAWAPSIFRLGILFHEARHSDGNGVTQSFFHAICPAGSAYEGLPACDRNRNGPYTVGALVTRSLLSACYACGSQEREVLKLIIGDFMGRILPSRGESMWDDTPEGHR